MQAWHAKAQRHLATGSVRRMRGKVFVNKLLSVRRSLSSFSIDRSGLIQYGPKWPSNEEIIAISQKKEPATPLVQQLRSLIKVRGPITVHEYMAQV
jgi:hypothetical protein